MCIVRPDGPPQLCKTDEIGEIIVNSRAGGNMYYGLPGVTKNTFEVWQQIIQSVSTDTIKWNKRLNSFLFVPYSLSGCAQVIPVNANGVPIGEIPFVRSGLLGFVGPVSRTVSLQHSICGNLSPPRKPSFCLCLWMGVNTTCIMTPRCVSPVPSGQPDICSGEDRRSVDGQRAETQRWWPGGNRSCCGAS